LDEPAFVNAKTKGKIVAEDNNKKLNLFDDIEE
jgi:hypothetical protein